MKNRIYIALICAFSILLAISSGFLIKHYIDSEKQSELYGNLIETIEKTDTEKDTMTYSQDKSFLSDYQDLYLQNNDMVGWIKIEDTKINYPVMQSKDNPNFYLKHGFDKAYTDYGCPYIQENCDVDIPSDNLIIYGHNMKNNTMFGSLPKYSKQEYYEEHSVLYLLTPKQNYKVKLIAGYVTPSDSKVYEFEKTKEERSGLLKTALDNSLFTSGTTVSDEDRLLTLSTCSYEYDNARFVLMGILKEIG